MRPRVLFLPCSPSIQAGSARASMHKFIVLMAVCFSWQSAMSTEKLSVFAQSQQTRCSWPPNLCFFTDLILKLESSSFCCLCLTTILAQAISFCCRKMPCWPQIPGWQQDWAWKVSSRPLTDYEGGSRAGWEVSCWSLCPECYSWRSQREWQTTKSRVPFRLWVERVWGSYHDIFTLSKVRLSNCLFFCAWSDCPFRICTPLLIAPPLYASSKLE